MHYFNFFLSFTILSCAKKDESTSSSASPDNTSTNTELEGAWVSSCHSAWSSYWIKTWTFTGSALVVKWDEHSDSSCATDYAIWTDTYSSFSIGNEATLDNGSTGRKFTMKVDSLVASMQTAAAVTYYNNYVLCVDSEWVLNTAKDYSGKTCGSTDYPAANTNIYGVYLLEGSSLLINTDNITSVDSTVFTKQ